MLSFNFREFLKFSLLFFFLLFFSYPNQYISFPPFILIYFIFINYLAKKKYNFLKELYFALAIGYLGVLYWIYYPCYIYGGFPLVVSIFFPFIICLYLAIYPFLYFLLLRKVLGRLNFLLISLLVSFFWVILSIIREFLFSGFPWLNLSLAFAPYPFFIQVLKLIGDKGVSFLIVLLSLLVLGSKIRYKIVSLFVFAIFIVVNLILFKKDIDYASENINVKIVQGNIDQDKKWDKAYQIDTINRYISLSKNKNNNSKVIIWPETALPFYLQEENELSFRVKEFVKNNNVYLIVGAPGYRFVTLNKYLLYNRAYLLSPKGNIIDYYEKQKLVPFGEYLPFTFLASWFNFFYDGVGDFSPGIRIKPFYLEKAKWGMLICYEVIFPLLVQKRVEAGAQILVNISNDAWFGDTAGPYQHLYIGVLRAIEQNRMIIRATNSGISAFIFPNGRIKETLGLFRSGTISEKVVFVKKRSFFSRYFYFYFYFYFIGFFLILLILWLRGNKNA